MVGGFRATSVGAGRPLIARPSPTSSSSSFVVVRLSNLHEDATAASTLADDEEKKAIKEAREARKYVLTRQKDIA